MEKKAKGSTSRGKSRGKTSRTKTLSADRKAKTVKGGAFTGSVAPIGSRFTLRNTV